MTRPPSGRRHKEIICCDGCDTPSGILGPWIDRYEYIRAEPCAALRALGWRCLHGGHAKDADPRCWVCPACQRTTWPHPAPTQRATPASVAS